MAVPESDWKNKPGKFLNWLLVLIAVALFLVHGYLWFTLEVERYLALAIGFFVWLVVFYSRYWQSVLYLVSGLLLILLLSFWFVYEVWQRPIGRIRFSLGVIFLLLSAYLFFKEERFGE